MAFRPYVITEQDKIELELYKGLNELTEEYYRWCSLVLRKSKWNAKDLQQFNGQIDNGLGKLLYELFEIRAHHPLFLKYYPEQATAGIPPSLEELKLAIEAFDRGEISKDGLQVRKVGKFTY